MHLTTHTIHRTASILTRSRDFCLFHRLKIKPHRGGKRFKIALNRLNKLRKRSYDVNTNQTFAPMRISI